MTQQRKNNPMPRQRLIDEFLDGETTHEEARNLFHAIRQDDRASEELARTRILIERLREPMETPDLSEAILDRVHGRRRYLLPRARRLVTAGRLAVAAGLIGAVGLASIVQRHAPAVHLGTAPATVSEFVEATEQAGAEKTVLTEQAVETIQASLASPIHALSLSPRFRPEADLHFDLSLDRSRVDIMRDYTVMRTPIVLGAPEQFEYPVAQSESPFLERFGSLLVILRKPQPMLDEILNSDSENAPEGTSNK